MTLKKKKVHYCYDKKHSKKTEDLIGKLYAAGLPDMMADSDWACTMALQRVTFLWEQKQLRYTEMETILKSR